MSLNLERRKKSDHKEDTDHEATTAAWIDQTRSSAQREIARCVEAHNKGSTQNREGGKVIERSEEPGNQARVQVRTAGRHADGAHRLRLDRLHV